MALRSANITVMIQAVHKAARHLVRDFGEVENLQVSIKGRGFRQRRRPSRRADPARRARPRPPDLRLPPGRSGVIPGEDREQRWVVDPLDGTTFLHGLPHFAISVALERRGELIAGVVYDPIKDELFCAEKPAPISTIGGCGCPAAATGACLIGTGIGAGWPGRSRALPDSWSGSRARSPGSVGSAPPLTSPTSPPADWTASGSLG